MGGRGAGLHAAREPVCPDGEICADDARRVEVWGSCWPAYYQLDPEQYFMSGQARAIVDVLNRSHLWAKTLSSRTARTPRTASRRSRTSSRARRRPAAACAHLGRLRRPRRAQVPARRRALRGPGALSKAADAAVYVAKGASTIVHSQLTKRHLACGCSGVRRAVHRWYLARKGPVALAPRRSRPCYLSYVTPHFGVPCGGARARCFRSVKGGLHGRVAREVRRVARAGRRRAMTTLALGPDARRGRSVVSG